MLLASNAASDPSHDSRSPSHSKDETGRQPGEYLDLVSEDDSIRSIDGLKKNV